MVSEQSTNPRHGVGKGYWTVRLLNPCPFGLDSESYNQCIGQLQVLENRVRSWESQYVVISQCGENIVVIMNGNYCVVLTKEDGCKRMKGSRTQGKFGCQSKSQLCKLMRNPDFNYILIEVCDVEVPNRVFLSAAKTTPRISRITWYGEVSYYSLATTGRVLLSIQIIGSLIRQLAMKN